MKEEKKSFFLDYMGEIDLFNSHFIIGCDETIRSLTQTTTIEIESFHNFIEFTLDNLSMNKYRDKVQYVSFRNIIDLNDFICLLDEFKLIYQEEYPYSTKEDFIEDVIRSTIHSINNFLDREFHWIGNVADEKNYDFYSYYLRNYQEFIVVGIPKNQTLNHYKQYYEKVIQVIDNLDYEFPKLKLSEKNEVKLIDEFYTVLKYLRIPLNRMLNHSDYSNKIEAMKEHQIKLNQIFDELESKSVYWELCSFKVYELHFEERKYSFLSENDADEIDFLFEEKRLISKLMNEYVENVEYVDELGITCKSNELLFEKHLSENNYKVVKFSLTKKERFVIEKMGKIEQNKVSIIQGSAETDLNSITPNTNLHPDIFKDNAFEVFNKWMEISTDKLYFKVSFIFQQLKKDEQLRMTGFKPLLKWCFENQFINQEEYDNIIMENNFVAPSKLGKKRFEQYHAMLEAYFPEFP